MKSRCVRLTNENPWRLVAEDQMSTATAFGINGKAVADEFEEIFREHYQLVYRTAYGVTGNRQDAEDVLQTIFLRLVQREVAPDLRTSPRKYLYRAAINAALDTVRNRKRQRLADAFEHGDFPATDAGSNSKESIQQRLVDAMAQLSPQAVEILILRYQQGYSDAQIAAMLGKSRGVIAVSLYRSRRRLKILMQVAAGEDQ
jgi:RNA polymerase sigma-70 factor (ECF subfamily)